MPDDPGEAKAQREDRSRSPRRSLPLARPAGSHSFRQRPRIYREGAARMAGEARRQYTLHRTGKRMGERLLRELQLQAQRRTARAGNLLHDEGNQNVDRMVATTLQHVPPALIIGLQTAGARSRLANAVHAALGSDVAA